MRSLALRLMLLVVALGCGGGNEETRPPKHFVYKDPIKPDRATVNAGGEFLWWSVVGGHAQQILASGDVLDTLITPEARARYELLHAAKTSADDGVPTTSMEGVKYEGVCIQTLREEPAGLPIGLINPAWIFEHVLVMGRSPDGHRLGFWLDGVFVFTPSGLRALDLRVVTPPTPETTEMALALCDLSVGIRADSP